MNRRSLLTSIVASAAVSSIGGCTSVPNFHPLDPSADVAPRDGRVLVILGFSYVGPLFGPVGPPSLLAIARECPATDPFGLATRAVPITRVSASGGLELGFSATANQVTCALKTPDEPIKYNFLHMLPGEYAIEGLRYEHEPVRIKNRLRTPLRFRVTAGEVLYIGDILIRTYYPPLIELGRSDAAVKAELAKRKGPANQLVARIISGPAGIDSPTSL